MRLDSTYGEYGLYVEPLRDNLAATLEMWKAHWSEQKEEEMRGVQFNPCLQRFYELEQSKLFTYITARKGDELVGHFGLRFGTCMNTSKMIAGDDFFYIKPEHRKGMLAVKLIKLARDLAFLRGAYEFSLSFRSSMPDLDPLLRRCGMRKIAHVYTVRS